jgi:organic radical activating enzyme
MTKKSQNQINIENMMSRMAEVQLKSGSKTICLAKWLQSTVYLMNGQTHSCHHPTTHKIPLAEIQNNPSALHNTKFKMEQRKLMLNGEKPSECQYCWNIEDLNQNHISDRVYKSTDEEWSYPHLSEVLKAQEGQDISPTYLEIAFDNTCNMKCMYCTPDISSKWMEEVNTFGPYSTSNQVGNIDWLKASDKFPIAKSEDNLYVDAFWKWWPNLYSSLKTFRITGGEPLLSKNTWRVFEEIKNNPRSDFILAINTNFQVPDQLFDKFIYYYNEISPKIKKFEVYTSCEAHGPHAEYIRTGLKYESFLLNINKFFKNTGSTSRINLMITFNILSLSSFDLFLKDIWELRTIYNPSDALNRLPMMINYLRWPQFQDVRMASKEIKLRYLQKIKDYMKAHMRDSSPDLRGRFYLEEIDQINRLGSYMLSDLSEADFNRNQNDFSIFFKEFDRRRNTSLLKLYPELSYLYENKS